MDTVNRPDLAAIISAARFLNERQWRSPSLQRGHVGEQPGRLRQVPELVGGKSDEQIRVAIPASDAADDDFVPLDRMPPWARTLAEVIRCAQGFASPADISMAEDYAFGELLLAFVVVARHRVQARLSVRTRRKLAPSAYRDIDRAIMTEMQDLLGEVLLEEFSKARLPTADLLGRLLGRSADIASDRQYRRFVADNKADGLARLFELYPVLGRLAASRLDDTVDFLCEFLEHLNADLPELSAWDRGLNDRLIAHLTFGLSDYHRHGRSVIVAKAQSGRAIVYKPRSLAPEQAWNEVLAAIDADLRRPFVIDRGSYGWMEYIEPAECPDVAGVERFFVRVGKLLCGAYIFGGKDFHRDNLIAAGDQPVLIDLETLGQPDPGPIPLVPDPVAEVHHLRNELFSSSVMRAEFLPRRQSFTGGQARDDSALSSPADHVVQIAEWCALNSDFITKTRSTRPAPGTNLPGLDGVPVRADDYAEAILSGFSAAWATLAEIGPRLVTETGPASAFRQLPFRFIFRGTEIYFRLLRQASTPQNLTNGVDFSFALQPLHRALDGVSEPRLESLVVAEIDMLQRGDIPRFGGSTASDTLDEGLVAPLAGHFEMSGIESIERRLAQLTPERLALDLRVIATVLAGERSNRSAAAAASRPFAPKPRGRFGPEAAMAAASALGDECLEAASALPNHGLCWVGLVYREEASGFQAEMLGDSLYDGNAGMALFFSALYQAGCGERFREGALRALVDLRTMIQNISPADRPACVARLGMGAGAGIGGLVYALGRVGSFLNDSPIVEDAHRLSRWVSRDLIADAVEWDVLTGLSGTIGGLLALAQEDGGEALMSARACGDHMLALLAEADLTKSETKSFAHGSAGAAAQLGRLGKRAGDPAFYSAARKILHEAPLAGGRSAGPDHCSSFGRAGWCNGAAGRGLASLAALTTADCANDSGLISAIDAIRQSGGAAPTDQICCGVFGAIDLLLSAGRRLGRPELEGEAWRLAAATVGRATEEGGFRLLPGVPLSYRGPSLFQGLAGIGYGLLRLAAPDRFPSVLTME